MAKKQKKSKAAKPVKKAAKPAKKAAKKAKALKATPKSKVTAKAKSKAKAKGKPAPKANKKANKKAAKAVKKAAPKASKKAAPKAKAKVMVKKVVRKATPAKPAPATMVKAVPPSKSAKAAVAEPIAKPAAIVRERKTLPDNERLTPEPAPAAAPADWHDAFAADTADTVADELLSDVEGDDEEEGDDLDLTGPGDDWND